MSLNAFITKELLFAYFAGKATALQKQRIEEWKKDPAQEAFFYDCVHEWEKANPQYVADVNQAINKFDRRISGMPYQVAAGQVEEGPIRQASATKKWPAWLVAASVALLLGMSGWLFGNAIFYITYHTGYGQIRSIALPDGSQVMLNANSILTIPRFGFGSFSRQVSLRGEANFSVVHTPDHKKFVVLTDSHCQVVVLGTEFNVFARKRGTKVGLYRGKVQVLYRQPAQQAKTLTMAPGDLMTLDESRRKVALSKVPHPENFSAWQQGRFIFELTPLAEIKNTLQENYGLEVELRSPGLAEKTISGSFKASSVNELLRALSETLDIQVIRQDNHVVLTDKY